MANNNGRPGSPSPSLKRPLRQNVAIAVDGGGIRGVIAARALMRLEEALGRPITEVARLTAGTSTGAIILAAIAMGMDARTIHGLYEEWGPRIFPRSWRTNTLLRYTVRYRYSDAPLRHVLREQWGDITMGELHRQRPDFHMVLTATDILANTTRFIKLYKKRYADWLLRDVVMASSTLPSIFPVFVHDYNGSPYDPPEERWLPRRRYWVDGGVGLYSNPCYTAAYEVAFCLRSQGWRLDNTTLISIGTGKLPMEEVWGRRLRGWRGRVRSPRMMFAPEWVFPSIDTFVQDSNRQQVRLVRHFFGDAVAERAGDPAAGLDFRRYNIMLERPIEMDDARAIPDLTRYGEQLGEMIVNDEQEEIGGFACGGPFTFAMRGEQEDRIAAI